MKEYVPKRDFFMKRKKGEDRIKHGLSGIAAVLVAKPEQRKAPLHATGQVVREHATGTRLTF
jgi:hypothetical protein